MNNIFSDNCVRNTYKITMKSNDRTTVENVNCKPEHIEVIAKERTRICFTQFDIPATYSYAISN